jgi:hypothetical protein
MNDALPPHRRREALHRRAPRVFVAFVAFVVVPTGLLIGAAQCPSTTPVTPAEPAACPSLDAVCPTLSCVEPRRNDDGCPLCECEVQACVDVNDCLDRGVDVTCDTSFRFCEPAPGCTDGDSATPCPSACYGRCVYAGERSRTDGYCSRPDDCAAGESCLQTACVDDPTTPTFFDCVGWCAGSCDEVVTPALDPLNGSCVFFPTSCVPPGWRTDVCR